jgi:PHD/YefM family antitoxin component YafN of YafNO toxin-antitoxin module
MRVLHVSEARDIFEELVEYVSQYHAQLLIAGERSNAVLISEKYWSGIQETLYLMAAPGLSKSIKKSRKQSIKVKKL